MVPPRRDKTRPRPPGRDRLTTSMRRAACLLLLMFAPLSVSACGPGRGRYGRPAHNAERATVAGTEVSDEAFAGAVRNLLASEPNSRERQLRLQGVVGRQMVRVAARFKSKDRDRAVSSLQGAMYLVHSGELKNEMLGSSGLRGAPVRLRRVREARRRGACARHVRDAHAHLAAEGEGRDQGPPRRHLRVDARHRRRRRHADGGRARGGGGDAPPARAEPGGPRRGRRADDGVHREGRSGAHGAPRARRAGHARGGARGGPRARDGRDGARGHPPPQRRPAGRARRDRQGARTSRGPSSSTRSRR